MPRKKPLPQPKYESMCMKTRNKFHSTEISTLKHALVDHQATLTDVSDRRAIQQIYRQVEIMGLASGEFAFTLKMLSKCDLHDQKAIAKVGEYFEEVLDKLQNIYNN